jgi:hypothetical protein
MPQNTKEARLFGLFARAVTCCRNVFPKRSRVLKPPTELAKPPTAKLIWTPEAQKAFNQMKALIPQEVTDHNKELHVITNASNCQLQTH